MNRNKAPRRRWQARPSMPGQTARSSAGKPVSGKDSVIGVETMIPRMGMSNDFRHKYKPMAASEALYP